MSYEINVSKLEQSYHSRGKSYRHFFATAERSIDSKERLKEIYNELKNAFPEPEYNITISYIPNIQYGVNVETFEHEME
jgi:hypothetical protein